jgi:hypothetical protein
MSDIHPIVAASGVSLSDRAATGQDYRPILSNNFHNYPQAVFECIIKRFCTRGDTAAAYQNNSGSVNSHARKAEV